MPSSNLQALFHSLPGTWHLARTLTSTAPSDPCGTCTGTATYTTRAPSVFIDAEDQLQLATAEMLYHERGEFEMRSAEDGIAPAGALKLPFRFERKYVWRLSEVDGRPRINVWFAKPGTDEIDYLFHDLLVQHHEEVVEQGESEAEGKVELSGDHLCVEDFYSSTYTFSVLGGRVQSWTMTHEVRGPKKDQIIETIFTRT